MIIEALDHQSLASSLRAGSEYLEMNATVLDNLNVFPVPDGDTGINMSHTLKAGVLALDDIRCESFAQLAAIVGKKVVENSRGNSGFILAQFFNGFFQVAEKLDSMLPEQLVSGFTHGSYLARTSLFSPVEGTMITIIADMVEAMSGVDSSNILDYFATALASARKSIHDTPALLPILGKAGVVDSGALGFIFLVEGMARGLSGDQPEQEPEERYRFKPMAASDSSEGSNLQYRYCTELAAEVEESTSIENLKILLPQIGNSIALMFEDRTLKLHVHTNDPERITTEVCHLGTIVSKKVDDMADQISQLLVKESTAEPCGVLAVVPGDGFAQVFQELGATGVVCYRETLPTTGAILNELNRMEEEKIILLPNDTNIIPAATLARDQCDKNIAMIATKNVVEGVTAMYGFLDDEGIETNLRAMAEDTSLATCLKMYRCRRESTFGDRTIKKGDYFVVGGDEIVSSDTKFQSALVQAIDNLDLTGLGSITLYYGLKRDASLAQSAVHILSESFPHMEVETLYGGQKKALMLVAVE